MRIAFSLLLIVVCSNYAIADPPPKETQWGDLTGQLIFDGEPPERKRLEVKAGFPEVWDESLVIDPKTHGIANIFVYLLKPKDAEKAVKVHPNYAEQIKKPVRWLVEKQGYRPHALAIHTNQLLIWDNHFPRAFNVKMDPFSNGASSMLLPPMQQDERNFSNPERLPVSLGCNIHEWLSAYLLILDHPYVDITDEHGSFTIKNLPVGKHEFQFWQEISGYVVVPSVHLWGEELQGHRQKGRLIINIKPGVNDLGEIRIDPVEFE